MGKQTVIMSQTIKQLPKGGENTVHWNDYQKFFQNFQIKWLSLGTLLSILVET
jgi:hypothetical protein